ncbi:MAG TPA: 50S ribosomal protein L6 [Treponemataceae bacterium]|jgi:large subunit ribosomal protein L6|nr:50S ribosomal protein L6 [Treponemataceae bacterium]
MSRIGKLPVAIPAGVKVTVAADTFTVEGPKGKLSQAYDPIVEIKVEGDKAVVTRKEESKRGRSCHGLYRNLLNNMVLGVANGFSKSLVVNGVGYRAEVQGKLLVLNLGYSNDFIAAIPEGLSVTADAQGKITITGVRKDQVGEFAAEVRKLRGPEPYKGKGIRYETEVIKRKVGKSGVK